MIIVDGDIFIDIAQRYEVLSFPTFVVVDRDGQELYREAGGSK